MRGLEKKYAALQAKIAAMDSVLVAYSGGVDSTLLLKVACDVLGNRVTAVIADSPSLPAREKTRAIQAAKKLKIPVMVVKSAEMRNRNYVRNRPDRCYWCKKELFVGLRAVARKKNISCIVEGSNYDDRKDYRPGFKAVQELGIESPLYEARLTKAEIRELSRRLGLATWQLPAAACLASRIPYGIPVDERLLKKIERAEELLQKLGIEQVRVRHHGDIARIETAPEFFPVLLRDDIRAKAIQGLKRLGYVYVAVELQGYRMGSLNAAVKKQRRDSR